MPLSTVRRGVMSSAYAGGVAVPTELKQLRARNMTAVLNDLFQHGPSSRTDVAERTGLSNASLTSLVDELSALGVLVETGRTVSNGRGRPRRLVEIDARRAVLIVCGVTTDAVRTVAVDLAGTTVLTDSVAARVSHPAPAEVASLVAAAARRLWGELAAEYRTLAHVEVVLPAVVDLRRGLVRTSLEFDWRDPVDFNGLVGRALGMPEVTVSTRNQARVAGLAEYRALAAASDHPVSDVVCLMADSSVGGAAILDGRVLDGLTGVAGELEHVVVDLNGRPCACGNWGCLATFIGPERVFDVSTTADGAELSVAETAFFARLRAGDPAARARVTEMCDPLAVGTLAAVAVYNPEYIVLGGYLGQLWPELSEGVRGRLRERLRRSPIPAQTLPEIVPARLGPEASLLGAISEALREVRESPMRFA